LDGYSIGAWGLAFTATASASAALTGLLFVALSINLKQIVESPGLTARAIEALVLVTSVLIISTLLLMPGQPGQVVATEIILLAIALSTTVGAIQLRTNRKALGVTGLQFGMRVLGAHAGPVLMVVGAISLVAQTGGGLYWVVPALVATMVASIIGAWVMLVEIVR
jgi:hypothetical protein